MGRALSRYLPDAPDPQEEAAKGGGAQNLAPKCEETTTRLGAPPQQRATSSDH